MSNGVMTAVAVLVALVSGFGAFAALRWIPYTIRTRMQVFDALLTKAGVELDEQVRARLEPQAARRHVWGAVGGGVGYGVALAMSLPFDLEVLDGAEGGLAALVMFVGSAVGQSASVLFPVNPVTGSVRVTAMQPHGMSNYLHRREILAEAGLAIFAWVNAVVGTSTLTGLVDIGIGSRTAAALTFSGALLAVVATTTLLIQRRLLAAPRLARDQEDLVATDIVLAVGLQDLLAVTMATAMNAAVVTLFVPGRSWWLVATFGTVTLVAVAAAVSVRKRPLMPVAHRLSARSISA